MPEGPSIVILKEQVQPLQLEGTKVLAVLGNTSIDAARMSGKTLLAFRSWGKHFLICFEGFSLRVHFMMFGTYRINERKETPVRLSLIFENAELNFYTCSLKFIEGNPDDTYDWSADVMSDQWNPRLARKKIKQKEESLICDILLDQNIFSGVGNIIKNEVLYRTRVHPLTKVNAISPVKLSALIKEARQYSFDFLEWKKAYVLKKHWLVHTKKICPLGHPIEKLYLGKTNRRTFFCSICQKPVKST
ncbi:DNA-formamidopyrimidine glycosylase family protein [Pedobacter steynii]|uniref:Endonuclease n=1 Tax=Pedobacter steynii TaxID=430522 RepID=A0A1D7QQ19_9SPHI|nr:DNA-formamidopyrimidine glycosylase family protein [Pedobacter steynii]AOM80711.1 endonuclease [Pedobacter steynii]